MALLSDIKEVVINIGLNSKMGDSSRLNLLMSKEPFYNWGDKNFTNQLDDFYLIIYFKGLVIIEKEVGSYGSTTPAARAYWEIENRRLDQDHTLADWAFQFSDNEYIPFGFIRHGEQTAYEYLQWREDFHNRVIQERLDKEERKKQQLERAEMIEKEKRERDKQTRELYQRIMEKNPKEQVELILSDDKHIIYFYTPVIKGLLQNDSITTGDLGKLLGKLRKMKSTPFNKKLVKQIQEKQFHLLFHPKTKIF